MMSISNGTIPFLSHTILLCCNPFAIATVKEFPVFQPNEFFWEKHQKKDEEKWETYARCVREIMGKELGLALSE